MRVSLIIALVLLCACSRPRVVVGDECTLNSDCDEPLVCRLDRCRRQCVDSRDCGAGLRCLDIMAQGGFCQLEDEAECALASDCDEPLVCSFGTCTTECAEDRDCVEGATCMVDGALSTCVEPSADSCIYDSDCPEPLTCRPDQRCDYECREPRDCQAPRTCVDFLCQLPDAG